MKRKIVIEDCRCCPHFAYNKGYTPDGNYPLCMKTPAPENQAIDGYKGEYRELSYDNRIIESRQLKYREATGIIPDWCPLELN